MKHTRSTHEAHITSTHHPSHNIYHPSPITHTEHTYTRSTHTHTHMLSTQHRPIYLLPLPPDRACRGGRFGQKDSQRRQCGGRRHDGRRARTTESNAEARTSQLSCGHRNVLSVYRSAVKIHTYSFSHSLPHCSSQSNRRRTAFGRAPSSPTRTECRCGERPRFPFQSPFCVRHTHSDLSLVFFLPNPTGPEQVPGQPQRAPRHSQSQLDKVGACTSFKNTRPCVGSSE